MEATVFTKIKDTINSLDVHTISAERIAALEPLIEFIQGKLETGEEARLNFICTHNSRRSHLSQVWAQVMAAHFGIPRVFNYSGGTEATAMFPQIGVTLKEQGIKIIRLSDGINPVYAMKYGENFHPVILFSKSFNHPFNPGSGFAAILTCSQADKGCPFIAGAEKRIPITYEDPKVFDGSPQQALKYKERSLQIASEFFYVFSKISKK